MARQQQGVAGYIYLAYLVMIPDLDTNTEPSFLTCTYVLTIYI